MPTFHIQPGRRVRITKKIKTREGPWETQVDGRVMKTEHRPTGSWFTHGKNARLWLSRLILEKDDGEQTEFVIDAETVVTLLDGEPASD